MELLVNFGGDINAVTDLGVTPLRAASGNGHKCIAQLLLRNRALVNQTDINRYVHDIFKSFSYILNSKKAHPCLLEIKNLLKPKNTEIFISL